jgi:ABC-type phosphate transport system substrate-binding protein
VHLYARKPPSGTLDFFKDGVLGGKDVASFAEFIEDSTELSNAVAADPQDIGFIGMPYVLGKVQGFGGTNFLRPNDSDAGRQQNRRVEIWGTKR